MNGAAQPSWVIPAIIGVSIVFFGVIGWVVLRGYRWLRNQAEAAQRRAFEGLKVHDSPAPGLVAVVFHTYYGFIGFVTQTELRFWASPEEACEALRRLHRFNLKWAMFAYGAPIIPLLSWGNYLAQRRAVRRQAMSMLD